MELRTFIKQALLDIIGAVEDAQNESPSGCVVPYIENRSSSWVEQGVTPLQVIDFDVVVRADESSSSGAKIGVYGIGGGAEKETGASHESRIRLRVPIRYPSSKRNMADE